MKANFISTLLKSRIILMMMLLLTTCGVGLAQSIYYDAITLRQSLEPDPEEEGRFTYTGPEYAAILKKYFANNDDYKNNPFMKDFFYSGDIKSLEVEVPDKARTALKNIGGMNVTNFADGLARFLVKRMKEELNIVFFETFERELEKQKDLQELFPSTYSTLKLAKSEIYNYQRYLPALRQSFEYDLDEFLTNAYDWSTSNATDMLLLEQLRKDSATHNVVKVILFVAKELDSGTHPGEILRTITAENAIQFDHVFPNFKAYLQTANFFSQSLRADSDNDRYWISREEVSAFNDVVFIKIYLGLMYQKCPEISFTPSGTLKEKFKALAERIHEIEPVVKQLSRDLAETENAVKRILENAQQVKGSDYFQTAQSVLQLTESVAGLIQVDTKKIDELTFYAEHGSFLFANIESRAYSAAVFEAYTIFDKALTKKESKNNAAEVVKQFLKYGTFMATVAEAESSAEVADAIEAIALPTGSARIKREVAWNISLNAYLGGFYGKETISIDGTDQVGEITGIWAPVGIAASRNFRICNTNWSISLFGTIIDVGALASFRLDTENDQVESLPEITLENILSPGGYLVLGFPRIPVSIGYGYQLTPQLRNVTSDAIVLNDHADRWSGFIAVDIPLINFWSRSRKK